MEQTAQRPAGKPAGGVPAAATSPERWVDEYGDLLFNYAVGRVRNHHMAQDLVQDALIAACRARDRFEGRSTEKSWLVGILKNKIMDYFRKFGREQSFTDLEFLNSEMKERFDQAGHWLISKNMGPKEWEGTPDDAASKKEFWIAFKACTEKLPGRVAQVFILREVDGVESEEICSTLSISRSNLWVMLHRARMALRQCLEDNWFAHGAKGKA
jgi:RNA polymerase sigma-70 factor (ECF subfamily)